MPHLWLAERGKRRLGPTGSRSCSNAAAWPHRVPQVHAHRWRHTYAHDWKLGGGDTGDLMVLMGWSSEEMARHYGASAATERAQQAQIRMGIGENV